MGRKETTLVLILFEFMGGIDPSVLKPRFMDGSLVILIDQSCWSASAVALFERIWRPAERFLPASLRFIAVFVVKFSHDLYSTSRSLYSHAPCTSPHLSPLSFSKLAL